jgi:glycosyltransferase involved in cell wall biosynthesis
MKICHVNLARGFSGGERQTLQLILQQIKEGYQLVVVAKPDTPFANEIKKLDCTLVTTSHFLFNHKKSITVGCELIHVHEGQAIYWAWLQNLLHHVPYIVTRRIDNPLKNKFLSNIAYQKASCLVGLSEAIVDAIKIRHPNAITHKIPSSPVAYPVNAELIANIKNQFKDKVIVIQASNLLKHKGHNTSIEAFKLLQGSHPEFQLVLLGDGPEKENLRQQSQGMSNITFAGKQTDMGNWFAAADIFIHPSHSEGLGSVILEAIQAGLPVIGTNAGGIPDIIENNVSGLLVEAGNGRSLAEAITLMAEDEALKTRLLAGGKEKLKLFDIVYTCSLYDAIYRSMK